jgi:uncharacterized membrane protein
MDSLWAIGYDAVGRADKVWHELAKLEAEGLLRIKDLAVAARKPDGAFEVRHEVRASADAIAGGGVVGFLVGLMLLEPLLGPAGVLAALLGPLAGTVLGSAAGALVAAGVSDDFIRQVEGVMKPGSSALFLLASTDDLDRLLPRLHGLGGKVLRSSVDVNKARELQAALNAAADAPPGDRTKVRPNLNPAGPAEWSCAERASPLVGPK